MKKTFIIPIIIALFSFGVSCPEASPVSDEQHALEIKKDSLPAYYPFTIWDEKGTYAIIAEIESKELYDKYNPLFLKYGYSGNGPCWEGHITQILEELNPGLLQHIRFDAEAGSFFARADSRASQLKFVEVLSPIFSDLEKLEVYLKKADHKRIDD